jgi:DMSO/TMAO reductase YedYZ heme-binding membrane subunit
MTPAAIAVAALAAVGLAGFVVIVVSLVVVATGHGGAESRGAPFSASLAHALELCAGELALLALTAAVVLGVAATERHFLPPGTRVTAQIAHRAVALAAVGFLLVHILLETVSAQATLLDAVLPFTDARSRLYLGLGTIASDLVIAVIATSLARMRYAGSRHPQRWRAVHRSIYVAWPLAIVHGMLMQGGPGWAAWTYGICGGLVAVALTARIRLQDPRPPTENSMRELAPGLSQPQLRPGPRLTPAHRLTRGPRPAPAHRLAPGPRLVPAHRMAPPLPPQAGPRIAPLRTLPRLPRYPSSHPYANPVPPPQENARARPYPAGHSGPSSSSSSSSPSSPPWAPARRPGDPNEP